MIKVMFVCHGNICRSPMAEFIFKNIVKNNNMEQEFIIKSCATSTEEIYRGKGNPMYPPAKAELSKHSIPFEYREAVQLRKSDYDEYDYFIGMDSNNIRNIHRIFGYDPQHKVSKLMDYTNKKGDVADPWYSGNFVDAYSDIDLGCNGFFEYLKKKI